MTNEEAIHKLEYSKKAYQTLIDEKVDSGKLVGDGVRGEWKAETPLNEVYKSMIEALDMAIKALEQQPCEDCISREQAKDVMYALCDETETLEDNPWRENPHIDAIIDGLDDLPSATPKAKMGRWVAQDIHNCHTDFKCSACGYIHGFMHLYGKPTADYTYCPNCGARMEAETKIEQGLNFGDQDTMMSAT